MTRHFRSVRYLVTALVLTAISGLVFAETSGLSRFSDLFSAYAQEFVNTGSVSAFPEEMSKEESANEIAELSAPAPSEQLITASSYAFSSANSVALDDMSSGTTQLVAAGQDDTASPVTNIGFDFFYDGVRHTQFSVNANGLARLGPVVVATTFNNSTSGLGTTTNAPKIAPYFEDLCVGTNGKVHYKVNGTAPNRKLVVEWQNMQISRGTSCAGAGAGTFQMWLFESAGATTPGRIQFVYGDGVVASQAADLGASVGLQSGAATNFASVTVTDDSVSYTTANDTNLPGIPTGKSYIFTPNVPLPPSGLNFAPVTASSIQLNWTDNASNEAGFAVYRSTDGGTTYSFAGQTAADATSFNDTGLIPGTTYFYEVAAVSEGVISAFISGSQATSAAGSDTCAASGGNWSDTATWADGSIPTSTDNVTIGSGCTVTVDVTTAAAFNVVIDSGGTLQAPTSGTVTNNNLSLGGNLNNNGTLDLSTNSDTSGAILSFVATVPNVTFGGSGAVTDVREIVVNKGAQSSIVELTAANFTVRGVNTDSAGFLTLTSGTFKVSGSASVTNRVFTTAGYSIPALGGFWLNNPNFTVAGQNGSPTVAGQLRISDGTFNVGTSTGNSLGGSTGGQYIFEGGTTNIAGRLQTTSAISYTQSGGAVNVCTVGNTATTACFGLTSTANTFNMSGGTITLVTPSSNATPLDYSVSTSANVVFVTNPVLTTLNVGTGSAAQTFRVTGSTPSLNIPANSTMNVGSGTNGAAIFHRGATVVNNGAIAIQGTGTSSRFDWAASGPMTYSGTGTFGTAATPFTGVGMSANSPTGDNTTLNSPIFVNRVNLFNGGFTGSGNITLGDGAASTTVIQIGNSTTPTNAGTFDVSPVYNSGSGGHIALHLRTMTPNRPTGFEINTTRTLASWTIDDNAVGGTLVVTGGDITVVGALALTNGIVQTNANTIIHNGAATRTNGYVDGNLSRSYTATEAYTYHVGQNGYSPVTATITNLPTGPSSLTVKAVDATLPGLNVPVSTSRYWNLTEIGNITADLAFTYLDEDVNGVETDYRVFRSDAGIMTNLCSGGPCVNDATNTATVTGITAFSDWGIGENTAATPGVLDFDSATYSANEDAGTATITVTRSGGSANSVTVDYASVAGGSATGGVACAAGIDFVNASGTLTFANGDTSESFTVTTCPDTDVEPDETVNLALSNPTGGATIGAQGTSVFTILNDDVAGPANVVVNPGNTPYATLKEAIDAINAGTHTGAITVDVMANTTETASSVLNASGAGSANYTSIIIRAGADGVTVSGPSVQGRGLIELNGADNVTIDGDNPNTAGTNRNLTIQNTAANTVNFASVIRVALNATTVASADNNVFKNLNIAGNATGLNVSTATATGGPQNTTFGIFLGPNASGPTTDPTAITSVATGVAGAATAANLVVENNRIVTAARGVSVNGSATTVAPGLQIRKNQIGNPTMGDPDQVTAIGITANGSTNAVISENQVWVEGYVRSSSSTHGINVGVNSTNTSGATIEKNRIDRVKQNDGQSWAAYGINLGGGSSHIVRNNFVSGVINDQTAGTGAFGVTFGAYGIRSGSGTGHQIYHNSVNMYGAMGGVTNTNLTAAFILTGTSQTGVDVRNNVFVNSISGGNPTGTRNVAIYLPSGATSVLNLTLNNNDYFVGSDANNRMAQVGTSFGTGEYALADFDPTMTTPATNFRSYTSPLSAGGLNDDSSKKVDPLFVSSSDLHLQVTSPMQASGASVGVADDIDGDIRQTPPDLGADEVLSMGSPGSLQFSSATYSIGEAGGDAVVTVTRTGGSDGTVTVDYATSDGTAAGGASCGGSVDYVNASGTLSFANGETSKTFNVTICNDTTDEPDETLNYTLSNPTGGATLGTPSAAVQTIVDDDVPALTYNVAISDARLVEGNSGSANMVFDVTLTSAAPPVGQNGSPTIASVQYATSNGTATAGSDYSATSGTLNFSATGTQTVSVPVAGDTTKEANEFFFVNLSNPSVNTTITDGQGAGVIVDEDRPYVADFDRDLKSDFSVFRPSSLLWYALHSSDGSLDIAAAGAIDGVAAPGDYDGDGKADFAVFDTNAGVWSVRRSSNNSILTKSWGTAGDKPVQGDYDGDGKTDFAVFRPSTGVWWISRSSDSSTTALQFGISTDRPVQGDYDGDFKTDLAVYRDGTWYILRSSDGGVSIQSWGLSTDKPVAGDFDGDGRQDVAIYRDGVWWIQQSLSGTYIAVPFGLSSDVPAPADFDGDGTTDIAVFRGSTGLWYVLKSSDQTLTGVIWGVSTDVPVPSAYIPE